MKTSPKVNAPKKMIRSLYPGGLYHGTNIRISETILKDFIKSSQY